MATLAWHTFYECRETPLRAFDPILGAILPKPFVVDKEAAIFGGTCIHKKVIELDTDRARMNTSVSVEGPSYMRCMDEIEKIYCFEVHWG